MVEDVRSLLALIEQPDLPYRTFEEPLLGDDQTGAVRQPPARQARLGVTILEAWGPVTGSRQPTRPAATALLALFESWSLQRRAGPSNP